MLQKKEWTKGALLPCLALLVRNQVVGNQLIEQRAAAEHRRAYRFDSRWQRHNQRSIKATHWDSQQQVIKYRGMDVTNRWEDRRSYRYNQHRVFDLGSSSIFFTTVRKLPVLALRSSRRRRRRRKHQPSTQWETLHSAKWLLKIPVTISNLYQVRLDRSGRV